MKQHWLLLCKHLCNNKCTFYLSTFHNIICCLYLIKWVHSAQYSFTQESVIVCIVLCRRCHLCMKWSMNFWLCKQEFDNQHGVVTYCLQKSAEMQPQPQGVTTAAQKKRKTMTCFLYVKPPPVHITRGMKHWRRRKVAARPRSSGDSETQRGASRSSSLFPSEPPNFRARSQAPGSAEKTRTWQRCRCWTSPCWTTRARSETRFSSRSPSSAWRTYRRVSERLYVRHLRGFSTLRAKWLKNLALARLCLWSRPPPCVHWLGGVRRRSLLEAGWSVAPPSSPDEELVKCFAA